MYNNIKNFVKLSNSWKLKQSIKSNVPHSLVLFLFQLLNVPIHFGLIHQMWSKHWPITIV